MSEVSTSAPRGDLGWGRRATAKEVAALAGVSPQTVSRVANGLDNVLPETRERVLDAMARLGYAPNAAARALRTGRSTNLGLIAFQLSRTGEAHIVDAICSTARARGYDVVLTTAADGSAESLNRAMVGARAGVAGLVVLGLETVAVNHLRLPANLPVVIADSRGLSVPTVGCDQAEGARLAVEHLLAGGARTVHLVAGPETSLQSRQRLDSWCQVLLAAGREIPTPLHGDWSAESGYLAGRQLAADAGVEAIFVANDEMAGGVLRALHEAGRRIPEDVAVVGFDDVDAEYLWPPLTSLRQDFRAIGEGLVAALLEQVATPDDRVVGLREPRLIAPTLVVRASSTPTVVPVTAREGRKS